MGIAKKETEGKIRMDLLAPEVLQQVAQCLTVGASKYDTSLNEINYRKPHEWRNLLGATLRHINTWHKAVIEGDVDNIYDSETMTSHLANAIADLMILIVQEPRILADMEVDKMNCPTNEEDVQREELKKKEYRWYIGGPLVPTGCGNPICFCTGNCGNRHNPITWTIPPTGTIICSNTDLTDAD